MLETRREHFDQTEAMSCGAAALMCAAAELGVTRLAGGGGLSVSRPTEARIYQAICGRSKLTTSGRGYSLPEKVADYARQLGLTVTCYVPKGMVNTVISAFYSNIRPALQAKQVAIVDDTMPMLRRGQRALRVVRREVIGLHWVLVRPDASWMDPDGGREFTFFLNTLTGVYPGDTGISLILTAP